MDFTQAELRSHPLMKQMEADIASTRQAQQTQRMLDQMEAQRQRADQGRLIQAEFDQLLAEYEQLRKPMHALLGRMWQVAQSYARLTSADDPRNPGGRPPQGFHDAMFMRIDLPTLKVDPSPWAMPMTATTTKAAVDGWYASHGKEWVGQ
jgi:hypothetical protein